MKFVRVTEKKSEEVYDGVVINQDDKTIKLICAGPETNSPITTMTFNKREITIEPRTKEQVKSWLETAMVETDRKICNIEFDLLFAQKDRERRAILLEEALK